jgi:hypothetical protein
MNKAKGPNLITKIRAEKVFSVTQWTKMHTRGKPTLLLTLALENQLDHQLLKDLRLMRERTESSTGIPTTQMETLNLESKNQLKQGCTLHWIEILEERRLLN